MQPITLKQLLESKDIEAVNSGIVVHPQQSWVVPGEYHLSYTTLTRLVECCRELHWEVNVTPYISSPSIDSICKSFNAQFIQPVPVSKTITIFYKVLQIRRKGYEVAFNVCDFNNQEVVYAIFNGVFVFYNTETMETVLIPEAAKNNLIALMDFSAAEQNEANHE